MGLDAKREQKNYQCKKGAHLKLAFKMESKFLSIPTYSDWARKTDINKIQLFCN